MGGARKELSSPTKEEGAFTNLYFNFLQKYDCRNVIFISSGAPKILCSSPWPYPLIMVLGSLILAIYLGATYDDHELPYLPM